MAQLSLNDYDKRITDASFQILEKFLELINKKGIQSVIIGGWATEAFKEGIGSKDIDVVMLTDGDTQKLLSEKFFDDEETEQIQQVYPLRYEKQIEVAGTPRTIVCDIFNGENYREDYEELGIHIHWNLTHKFKEQRKIRNISAWVPKRELLIILKIIAAVDRSARLDSKFDDDENLESKIWKDYRDVAVLASGQTLDKAFLKKYITESGLGKYMDTFLSRYRQKRHEEVLDEIGTSPEDMDSALSV